MLVYRETKVTHEDCTDISYIKTELASFLLLSAITRVSNTFASWLSAAIAAPAPVSAFVHSWATVTAGIYYFSLNFMQWLNVEDSVFWDVMLW
jgi:NADH:ubiquinone oxidoreductase subunit 5 (subunit L)/multisubunit Na+/H+ antiporter MnhA subunit